ncbi:DMT family transporter [Kocuria sp.]|uniref:DMT family transporter n=1 Tax=Kocuria sp. TaxID=1871328 RepID=UPI0026DD6CF5|nr:DMT family transporter [Kocuria sp.]MDO4918766.1 DMT family transporter [Kocuria sp.]
MNRHRAAGLAALTLTAVLWGTTGTAATFAQGAGPLAIGAVALGLGGILQGVIAVPGLRRDSDALRRGAATVAAGAVFVAVYPLAFYTSMHLAGVAVGSTISLASAPLASGLLERLVDKTPLGGWWALSAVLGVAGSAMLCVATLQGGATSAGATVQGVLLGLVAGVSYAAYSRAVQRLLARGVRRDAAMGSVFGAGGLLLMPVLVLTGAPLVASPQNAWVSAYMALVPMFCGYVLFGFGLTRVPASTATTVTLLEPAVATVLAVLVVGERLSVTGWAGLGVLAVVLLILVLAPEPTTADASRGPVRRL